MSQDEDFTPDPVLNADVYMTNDEKEAVKLSFSNGICCPGDVLRTLDNKTSGKKSLHIFLFCLHAK